MPLITNKQSQLIRSFSADKDELYSLFRRLQERSNAAGDIDATNFTEPGVDGAELERLKQEIRDRSELKVTVTGIDGRDLFGTIDDVFNSPNFPEDIKKVYVNSSLQLRMVNFNPRNFFSLLLDFTKPAMLDFSFLPHQATPNYSLLEVEGLDPTWVNGVFSETINFIQEHKSQNTWIHGHSKYDLLLWILGYPLGFWSVYKLSGWLNKVFADISIFIQSAVYLYVFIATLFLLRIIFHYARWIWPLVEYRSPKSSAINHRLFLGAIVIGLIGSFIYDLIKLIII